MMNSMQGDHIRLDGANLGKDCVVHANPPAPSHLKLQPWRKREEEIDSDGM